MRRIRGRFKWGENSYEWSDRRGALGSERLHYNSQDYIKDESGEWKTQEEFGLHVLTGLSVEYPSDWDQTLYSKAYALDFNMFKDAARLEDQTVDGRQMIYLTAADDMAIPGLGLGDIERLMLPGAVVPQNLREKISQELSGRPDRVQLKHKFWVGLDDLRVYRVELEGTQYKAGQIVESFVETQTYSRFNEAELPSLPS